MLDSLFCRGNASKCKSLIKDIKTRVEVLRKKRNGKASLQRRDIAELLRNGEDQKALSRVDVLFTEENVLAVYDMIEIFCDCILKNLSSVQKYKDCPQDIKEAVSSLIFAAARCAEIPELQALRGIFATRYGDEFAIAARELHPDCGVNQQIIEKLSGGPPTSDAKLSLMREVAEKAGFHWVYSNLKDDSKRQQSLISSQNRSVLSHLPSSQKSNLDGTVVHHTNNGRILDSQCPNDVNRQKAAMFSRKGDLGQVGCEEDIYERVIPVVSTSVKEIPAISDNHEKTSQEEKPKPFSSSRRNLQKFAAEHVNQLDGVTSLAADCEGTSIKQQVKVEVVNHSFNTSPERQEVFESTRQVYDRSWKNKNSRHTSGGQCKDPRTKYRNGHPDIAFQEESKFFHPKNTNGHAYTSFAEESNDFNMKYTQEHANASFLEESNGRPEKYFGLKSATLLKSDAVHKSKPTGRASYLNVEGENLHKISEGLENRKLPDNYYITRDRSVRTGNGSAEHGEHGEEHSRQGGHNRLSRCREFCVENDELRMFDKPCEGFRTDATQGGKSEYQDLSKLKRNMRSKSNKMHSGSTWYDIEKGDIYHANDIDNSCGLPKNGSDYPSVEPSIKKSTGREVYSEEFLETQEGSTLRKVVNYPDKWNPTSQYIGGEIDNEVHNSNEYCNELDSRDVKFVFTTCGAGFGPSPGHERLHSRGSGTRMYYTNEGCVHDEVKHNIRREADNNTSKSINRKCHKMANPSQQVDNEEQHEIYYSVQETLYETNKRNLNSFRRVPYESQKHRDKGEQKKNYAVRDGGRLHNPVYLSNKNLYESVDHASDEEQHLWQSDCTKEYTNYTYPLNAESITRTDVGLQTQESKSQFGRKGSLDSPNVHGNHVKQHPEMQDNSFRNAESLGLYMNETHKTGRKSEGRHLDSCHWESCSINDNSTLAEHKRAYSDKIEQFVSGLNDVHQSNIFEKVNRHQRMQSKRKQKVSKSSDNYIQQNEQTNSHLVFSGSESIAEGKGCSPEKGRRLDIQYTKSYRTSSKQRTHEIQFENQSENLESASVKNTSRSVVPPGTCIAKGDSNAIPSDFSINRPLPPLPPSPAPKSSYVSPDNKVNKSANTGTEAPPQRPPPEHHRTVSMPSKSPARSSSLKAILLKSSSDVRIPSTRHVHPKLPDYDDLTAQFAALKQRHQSSNSE